MTNHLTRADIYDAIWKEPMCIVATLYEIAPSTLSKICQRYRIPTPSRGYWSRVEAGYVVARPPLPEFHGDDEVRLYGNSRRTVSKKRRLRHAPKVSRTTSLRLSRLMLAEADAYQPKNYYVAALQDQFTEKRLGGCSILSTHDRCDFRVSILPWSGQRVIQILDTLCMLAEINQLDIRPSQYGLAFGQGPHRVSLTVTEQITHDRKATSRLELRLDNRLYKDGIKRRFADHRRGKLENVLSAVVSSIERCINAEKRRTEEKDFADAGPSTEHGRQSARATHMLQESRLSSALENLEHAVHECREAITVHTSSSFNELSNHRQGRDAK